MFLIAPGFSPPRFQRLHVFARSDATSARKFCLVRRGYAHREPALAATRGPRAGGGASFGQRCKLVILGSFGYRTPGWDHHNTPSEFRATAPPRVCAVCWPGEAGVTLSTGRDKNPTCPSRSDSIIIRQRSYGWCAPLHCWFAPVTRTTRRPSPGPAHMAAPAWAWQHLHACGWLGMATTEVALAPAAPPEAGALAQPEPKKMLYVQS
jgi:hypothetical protein